MRSSTHLVLGINNVGDSKDAPEIFVGTFSEIITQMALWLAPRSMASRFDIVLARSEEEARGALRIRGRGRNAESALVDSHLVDSISRMMDQADEG